MIGFVLFLVAAGFVLFVWAPGKHLSLGVHEGSIETAALDQHPPTGTASQAGSIRLRVMTWNIAYGYGLGSEGDERYQPYSKEKIRETLSRIAKLIEDVKPDVVHLQEVDFHSARSGFIDEARFLAENTGLKFFAPVVAWNANYIPFPYFPFKRHFGKMLSGGAVLSRFPILENRIEIQGKPANNPWWYNLFYLNRYFQKVTIRVGDQKVAMINLHLDAYDSNTRNLQAEELVSTLKSDSNVAWVGGDFNSLPEVARKKSDFPASDARDRYEADRVFSILTKSTFKPSLPDAAYAENEARWFTFPSDAPNRLLDHLWLKAGVKSSGFRRVDEAKQVSDHLPIVVDVDLPQ